MIAILTALSPQLGDIVPVINLNLVKRLIYQQNSGEILLFEVSEKRRLLTAVTQPLLWLHFQLF